MKKILLFLVISNLVYGQDFMTVPDVFDKQCKTSFIKSVRALPCSAVLMSSGPISSAVISNIFLNLSITGFFL